MRDTEYTYTTGMDDDELTRRLRADVTGVLSLVDGDEAVGFPVAHYYDGETLYLRLCERPGSDKARLVGATRRASFVLMGGDGETAWSVVVRGPLAAVDGDEFDDATLNRWFAPVRLFDEAVEDVRPVVYRLAVDDIGGRRACGPVSVA
jgi:nitroimidazol reductase NimA-like FMN-containing flavoprotein (pyridoxamine 5'-phosphate oxidase superfamily)